MERKDNYFVPPHGGRPPSEAAIKEATRKYVEQERSKQPKREQKK